MHSAYSSLSRFENHLSRTFDTRLYSTVADLGKSICTTAHPPLIENENTPFVIKTMKSLIYIGMTKILMRILKMKMKLQMMKTLQMMKALRLR